MLDYIAAICALVRGGNYTINVLQIILISVLIPVEILVLMELL